MNISQVLNGKKTYLVVALGVIVNGMYALGYLPLDSFNAVNTILGFLGLGAVRSAMNK